LYGTADDRRRILCSGSPLELECGDCKPSVCVGCHDGDLRQHIDKQKIDKEKKIFTVPVLIGEKISRYTVLAMMILPYLFTGYLIVTRFFTPIMAIVLLAVPTFLQTYPALLKPKPETRPEGFPDGQAGGRFTLRRSRSATTVRLDLVHARIDLGCGVEVDPGHFTILAINFIPPTKTERIISVLFLNR